MPRTYLLLALALLASAAPVRAQQQSFPLPPFLTPHGTPEDRANCRSDAVKFCKEYAEVNNEDAVLRCFQANYSKLQSRCQGVLQKYGKAPD